MEAFIGALADTGWGVLVMGIILLCAIIFEFWNNQDPKI